MCHDDRDVRPGHPRAGDPACLQMRELAPQAPGPHANIPQLSLSTTTVCNRDHGRVYKV